MRVPYFEVAAFAAPGLGGNPAGVCPVAAWPSDEAMRRLAAEKRLSEVAYVLLTPSRRAEEEVPLRWFAPGAEVDLCGHATLAAAHVLWSERGAPDGTLRFRTRSGVLPVSREGERIVLDLPALDREPCPPPPALVAGLGARPAETFRSMDYVAVLEDEAAVRAVSPDPEALRALDRRGVVVTAPGGACDYVLRVFAPKVGIAEDPVTGSAQGALAPYWAERTGRKEFTARQLSARGGELRCRVEGGRVRVAGRAETVSRGTAEV